MDDKDNALLAALGRQPHNTSSLARATGINWMTVSYRLKRLEQLRLIQEKPAAGRQRLWTLRQTAGKSKRGVKIYYDAQVRPAYVKFFSDSPKQSTIYTIEGKQYPDLVRNHPERTAYDTAGLQTHSKLKRSKVVMKSIVHPECLASIQKNRTELLQSQLNKPGIMCLPANVRGLDQACLYAFGPQGMLIKNIRKGYVIVIRDPEVTTVLYTLIGVLYDSLDYTLQANHHSMHQLVERMLRTKV